MNIVVIVEDIGVDTYKKWSSVKTEHPTLTKDDFVQEGEDFICMMDKKSYMVSKDVSLLENLATEKVFGKKETDWKTIISLTVVNLAAWMILGG